MGGGGGSLIFSCIRRLGSFLGFFRKINIFFGYENFVDIFLGHHKIGLYLGVSSMHFMVFS